jgi:hypothetical protein
VNEKLVRRHPHVFGDRPLETSDQVLVQWEQIKAARRSATEPGGSRPLFKELPPRLPALMYAEAVWKQMEKKGCSGEAPVVDDSRGSRPWPRGLDDETLGRMLFERRRRRRSGAWTPRARCAGTRTA